MRLGDKFSRDTADVFSKLVVVCVALQRLKLLNNCATFSNECGFLNRFQATVVISLKVTGEKCNYLQTPFAPDNEIY